MMRRIPILSLNIKITKLQQTLLSKIHVKERKKYSFSLLLVQRDEQLIIIIIINKSFDFTNENFL